VTSRYKAFTLLSSPLYRCHCSRECVKSASKKRKLQSLPVESRKGRSNEQTRRASFLIQVLSQALRGRNLRATRQIQSKAVYTKSLASTRRGANQVAILVAL